MSGKVKQLRDEGTRTQVVIAGAVSGLAARFVIAPLDVIKIRLQLQIHSLSDPLSHHGVQGPIYKGVVGTARQVVKDEGLTALWKGNIPAEGLYLGYGVIQFLTYRTVSAALSSPDLPIHVSNSANAFLSGAFAGTVGTTFTYPLDLLRTRFAAQGKVRVYEGLIPGIKHIYHNERLTGFFRGLGAANAQIIPYMGLFFALYETLKPIMNDAALPLDSLGSGDGIAGMLASIMSKSAVYPLDTVRKRLQVQGPMRAKYVHRNIPEYAGGVTGTIRMILKREGARGMYRGLTLALIKAAPTSAVSIWTFERVMAVLTALGDEEDTA